MTTDPTGTTPTFVRVADVLARYAVGSDEWTWAEERADLEGTDAAALKKLSRSIRRYGIREPICLGDDGRVWDGHHRLLVAEDLGIEYVPVVFGTSDAVPASTGAIPQEAVEATARAIARAISRHLAGFHTEPAPMTVKVAEVALAAALPTLRAQWIAEAPVTGPWGAVKEIEQLTADLAAARTDVERLSVELAEANEDLAVAQRSFRGWQDEGREDLQRVLDDLAAARQQLDAVRTLAEGAKPGLAFDPADCTYACDEGCCNCSGVFRVLSWSLDPAAVLAALAVAPTDAPATRDGAE